MLTSMLLQSPSIVASTASNHRHQPIARLICGWPHIVDLGTVAIFLALLWLCSFLGRFWAKKTLHGQNVLITNGDAPLSQALAAHLTDVYHCRVVLLRSAGRTVRAEHTLQHHLRTDYVCNVLDTGELVRVRERLCAEIGYLDVLIDNGLPAAMSKVAAADDVRRFIEAASDGIRSTINLLITFVPTLARSARGHYVTIRGNTRDARPFLDSTSDVRRLIAHLQPPADFVVSASAATAPWSTEAYAAAVGDGGQQLQLSTVVVRPKVAPDEALSSSCCRDLDAAELAERVISGIRREQTLLELRERRGVLEYAMDLVWR